MTTTEQQVTLAASRVVKLTPAQTEVLRMTANGLKQEDIRSRLRLSKGAVSDRVMRMYRKLGVSGIALATRAAVKSGLV